MTVLDDEKHCFFTMLKRGENHVLRSFGSYGTWRESSTKKIYDSGFGSESGSGKMIIGFNKLLNFKVKGEGKEMKTTDWLMHEFSLVEKGSYLVLCVIYKNNKKKEEMALALERPPSVVDFGILGSPNSVFDQVDFFDGIDDTDMGGQDLYDDQDPFDENHRFASIDGHLQFQVLDSQEDGLTKNMGSKVEGLDQEKKGMECLPLPLSLVDFVDAHHQFDEYPSPATPDDQEEIAEKMAYNDVDGR
ncbi:hypothetical protein SO802_014459 [Lithocarpus litseifolius]|uniref:NAC domain-containing protein n=1 Tax=Lithocarpus litseifolius TaxID=425828 RepID=A0AAW2CR07_9ROSI